MKKIKLKFWVLICLLCVGIPPVCAQNNQQLADFTKQVMEAESEKELYPAFEGLTDLYFKENKYNEYVDFLNSLISQKESLRAQASYYIALSRYYQLKYLEQEQLWEEYFNRGNTYREEIPAALKKAIDALPGSDPLSIYARLILWKFHRDQEGALAEEALKDLISATSLYAQNTDNLAPIKDVARELFNYGEKAKAKEVYKIYADKISSSGIEDEEIKRGALSFYNEGNLDLAQNLYDIYIARIEKSYPQEKLIPALIDIAKLFSYKDQSSSDALYAEKIFKKIEETGGKDSFNEELLYLRAFNLESAKDYIGAKSIYAELITLFPQAPHKDSAEFKIAAISAFVLNDIKNAKDGFEKIAAKQNLSPQVISSLYQLGLLYQWEADYQKAKNYYDKLIELAKDNFSETVTAARQRLNEINDAKPIEYNLKVFLDTNLALSRADLKTTHLAKKDSSVTVTTNFSLGPTGCMNVEMQYLWSQDIGKSKPSAQQPSFSTEYSEAGTKIIALIVVSPSGVVAKDISFVDIE